MFPPPTRILVVDDMKTMRRLLFHQLTTLGFESLYEADDGSTGMEVLESQAKLGKPIDLIISDWNMPILTGVDFLRKVRSTPHLKNIPFVMVTAEDIPAKLEEATAAGVDCYIP